MSGLATKAANLAKVTADPALSAMGVFGKGAQSIAQPFDPVGTLMGLDGKNPRAPYDPLGLRMGLYGYDTQKSQDWGQYDYGSSASMQTAAVLPAVAGAASSSARLLAANRSSKTLLGD